MPFTAVPSVRQHSGRRLSVRPLSFKLALAALLLSIALFLVGFSCPNWNNESGLWQACSYGHCYHLDFSSQPTWFNTVRALEILALMVYMLCVGVEVYQDVLLTRPPFVEHRAVEVLAAISGTFGLIGVIIYVAKRGRQDFSGDVFHNDWALTLTAAANILGLLSAIILAISRNQTQASVRMVPGPTRSSTSNHIAIEHVQRPFLGKERCHCAGLLQQQPPPYAAAAPQPMASAGDPLEEASAYKSQVPAFYVLRQDRMVPVYRELPVELSTADNTSSA